MHRQNRQLQTAIHHLQHLPEKQQQVVFDVIEGFFETTNAKQSPTIDEQTWQEWLINNQAFIDKLGFEIGDEPSDHQKRFLMWRADYEKVLAEEDDWTNEKHDEFWANLRDRNDIDIGQEVSFKCN
ncbi:hypothetical protein [Moraxella oblonga]|uniref:hypothetical protein n=1 Tax=Moraxella oblonga TaxID=200413 RepID=UPI000836B165|nr:hypothetical protein [Moraxella oblonga]